MVRSVFTSSGVYAGKIWGSQKWGSPDVGEFYGTPVGARHPLPTMHRTITSVTTAILEAYAKRYSLAVESLTRGKPAPQQLTLKL